MDKRLIAAAAMAALLAGVSACGNNDYNKDNSEQTAPNAASENQTSGASDSDENYGSSSQMQSEPATTGQAMQSTSPSNTGGVVTPSDLAIVNVQQLTTKDDIDAVVDQAFTAADTNSDGKLDRTEYMTLAESALNYQPMASGAGMSTATGSTGDMNDTSAGSAMSAMPSSSASETEMSAAFTEAAGSDNMISQDELQKAFSTAFDRADSDNNGQLNTQERLTFAQLLAGGNTPAQ